MYEPIFALFCERVKESIQSGTFAKLTLAKTMGDTEIKNIYFRLVLNEDNTYSISLTARYKTEEIESVHTLGEALLVLGTYIKNPFLTALLFTTDNEIFDVECQLENLKQQNKQKIESKIVE
jgi:hypothetical protein